MSKSIRRHSPGKRKTERWIQTQPHDGDTAARTSHAQHGASPTDQQRRADLLARMRDRCTQ